MNFINTHAHTRDVLGLERCLQRENKKMFAFRERLGCKLSRWSW